MPTKTSKKPLVLNHEPAAVEYARLKAELSKKAAADAIGISAQLYGDIEAGRRNATPVNLKKMAQVFNCPIVVLERKRWAA